jgi:hypothetical protein
VAVDIVSFGCEEENAEKLEAFHSAVASNDNSHLVTVPPGTILSDMLFGTPIFMEEGAGGGGSGGGGGGAEGGGGGAPRSELTRPSLLRCIAVLVLHCLCLQLHRPALLCMHHCFMPALAPLPPSLTPCTAWPLPAGNVVDGFDYGELNVDPTLDPELVSGVDKQPASRFSQPRGHLLRSAARAHPCALGNGRYLLCTAWAPLIHRCICCVLCCACLCRPWRCVCRWRRSGPGRPRPLRRPSRPAAAPRARGQGRARRWGSQQVLGRAGGRADTVFMQNGTYASQLPPHLQLTRLCPCCAQRRPLAVVRRRAWQLTSWMRMRCCSRRWRCPWLWTRQPPRPRPLRVGHCKWLGGGMAEWMPMRGAE